MTALILALAWIGGVAGGLSFGTIRWVGPLGGAACLGAAWLAGGGAVRTVALAGVAAFFGVTRVGLDMLGAPVDPLAGLSGEVTLVGRVADVPTPRGSRTSFPLDVTRIERPGPPRDLPNDVPAVVQVRGAPEGPEYGELVEVRGRLGEPRSRAGYPIAELLARRGIAHVLDASAVRLREPAGPSGLGALYRLRARLEAALRSSLPEPHASLTAGIVLGTRSGTPSELRTALSATGTSHIVAVSGFNVAVVAGMVQVLATRLVGHRWALLPMLAAVWGYTLLAGAPASAIRAAVMASLVFGAAGVGRLSDPITTLALSGAAMLAWDPSLLLDLGFQLSMLATAGLVLFARRIADRLAPLPGPVREPLGVALAAQAATLPITLGTFHTMSLVSPLANLLIGAVIPLIMLCGALLAVLAPLAGLGDLLAWATWGLVAYTLGAINWAAELPYAVVSTGRLPQWVAVVWYALLLLWAAESSPDVRPLVGSSGGRRTGLAMATLALLPASAILTAPAEGTLRVSFLDAGGSAVFARAPGGRSVLLSDGEAPAPVVASVAERLALWERGLDLVVLTRGGDARSAALDETLRRYPAALQLRPPPEADDPAEAPPDGIVDARTGQRVDLGSGAWLEVVDVRSHEGQAVLDLELSMGDHAVWVPGPGAPSPRWREAAEAGRRVALRLPSPASAWWRLAPEAEWLAVVADAPASGRGEEARVGPRLDHRTYGAIEVALGAEEIGLRTERCPEGKGCLVTP